MLAVGYPLPQLTGAVVEEGALPTQAARLQQEKGRVKLLLETHGQAAWRRTVDAAPSTTLPRRASRAYYKLEELLRAHAVPPPRASLHLCEAPGGFVEATVDAFGTPWFATTLDEGGGPAWAESVRRLAGGTLLPSGDLRDAGFQEEILARLVDDPIDLVTADGAAPMDHDHLEAEALDLARAQVDVALRALAPGGTLILKVFECCTAPTLRLVARLCAAFAHCTLYKPTHSRPTNSELYLVCSEFLQEETTPSGEDVDRHWWPTTVAIVDELAAHQTAALQAALRATRVTHRVHYSHATVRAPPSTLR